MKEILTGSDWPTSEKGKFKWFSIVAAEYWFYQLSVISFYKVWQSLFLNIQNCFYWRKKYWLIGKYRLLDWCWMLIYSIVRFRDYFNQIFCCSSSPSLGVNELLGSTYIRRRSHPFCSLLGFITLELLNPWTLNIFQNLFLDLLGFAIEIFETKLD